MAQPLMPKATAVWLVENTSLTFRQIAEFCGLHDLEVQAIADGEVAVGMVGMDPIANGQLTQEEITRCEQDPGAKLQLAQHDMPMPITRTRGPRYTPITKRQDKPDAIAWLLKNHPELSDAAIGRLIGTTKPTIQAVRDRTHWNSANLKPRSPVELGLCSRQELAEALSKVRAPAAEAVAEDAEVETVLPAGAEGDERTPDTDMAHDPGDHPGDSLSDIPRSDPDFETPEGERT